MLNTDRQGSHELIYGKPQMSSWFCSNQLSPGHV